MQRGIFTAKSLSREAHAAYDGYARRPQSPLESDSRAFNVASGRLLASLLTTPIRLQSCLQLAGLSLIVDGPSSTLSSRAPLSIAAFQLTPTETFVAGRPKPVQVTLGVVVPFLTFERRDR